MSRFERTIAAMAMLTALATACGPDDPPVAASPATSLTPATPRAAAPGTGFDVAHPQCGASRYPKGQAFVIVGVNAGTPSTANPCLTEQLTWARTSSGASSVPAVGLYMVASNPGDGVSSWPSRARGTAAGATRYGRCDGTWTEACAFLYGVERATYSYGLVARAHTGVDPARVPWWLDVEHGPSWSPDGTLNVAAIRGFVAGLERAGASAGVGIYSTFQAWSSLTGLTGEAVPEDLRRLPQWVGGAGNRDAARARCSAPFTGGRATIAQFRDGTLDGNHVCRAPSE